MIKSVVLDIEGTVCSIAFVKDVLYPFAITKARELLPSVHFPLAPANEFETFLAKFPSEHNASADALVAHMEDLTAKDIKAPYLKGLQGYLWRSGYESGEIKVDLYDDAVQAIKRWSAETRQRGGGLYIYSSGSVAAQHLLFRHTTSGDLTSLFDGWFDTVNAGPKTEAASYEKIAETVKDPLFFSDNPAELAAAEGASWRTQFVVRPGNAAQARQDGVTTFDNYAI